MPISLQNDLTQCASAEIAKNTTKMQYISKSLSDGDNRLVGSVDCILGNGLQDKNILNIGIQRSLSYAYNLMLVADSSLSSISSELAQCRKIVSSACMTSPDKLSVLQNSLNKKIDNINRLLNNSSFDGKRFFKDSMKTTLRVGAKVDDLIHISIPKLTDTLFRREITNVLNNYLGGELGRVGGYNTQEELDQAILERVNFTQADVVDLNEEQLSEAIVASRDGNTLFLNFEEGIRGINESLEIDYVAEFRLRLQRAAIDAALIPNICNQVKREYSPDIRDIEEVATRVELAGGEEAKRVFLSYDTLHSTLHAASAESIEDSLDDEDDREQLIRLLGGQEFLNINSARERDLASNILSSALSIIRRVQSDVMLQKNYIIKFSDILKSRSNITEKVANSYLKTDYIITSQEFLENIRIVVVSITALNAGNRLSDSVQKLLESNI